VKVKAQLQTSAGTIELELYDADAPKTVANFVKLAKSGFYDGTKFHRVIDGFMVQGGDPLTKEDDMQARWGTGGPGYTFEDEIHGSNKNNTMTVAMANAGPNTNGSQFFINVANNNFLDTKHTVFGRVTSGEDTVHKVASTPTDSGDRPMQPIIVEKISVV
jgi:peptidylprolyl isomerase